MQSDDFDVDCALEPPLLALKLIFEGDLCDRCPFLPNVTNRLTIGKGVAGFLGFQRFTETVESAPLAGEEWG